MKDDWKKSYEQRNKCMRPGISEDSAVGDEQDNSEEYVDRTKEGQNDMYYLTGESIAVVYSSLFEENLRRKGHEELHVADPMEEYTVYQFKESNGTKRNPTPKKGLNLGDDDEKKTPEGLKTEFKPLAELTKDVLGDKAEMVIVSDRIVDFPCVLTTSEYGRPGKMERVMEARSLRDNSMTSHMVSTKTMEVNPTHSIMMELKKKADVGAAWRQQHKSSKHQPTKQSTRQERGGERKKERNREGIRGRSEQEEERDQEGRKEEERKVEERGSEQVERDAMDWTVVTRSRRKQRRVQIFVKVNGSKASPVEVSLTDDKVEDVLRQVQNDEDVYVTMHGRMLKKGEKLKSCGVTDGCTIQVTSRMRGGGRHKDKKSRVENKQAKSQEPVRNEGPAILESEKEAVIQMLEETEEYRKIVEEVSGGSDVDVEWKMRYWASKLRERPGADILECGLRWAVEARRKEMGEEKRQQEQEEQRRRQNARQEESKQGKQVRFGDEEQFEETRAESTDEQKVTDGLAEVRTGRGSAGLVRGGDERCRADETSRKGKGKGNGGKGEHGGKGDKGNEGKGFQHSVKGLKGEEEEDKRVQVAPNMGAGGSHPQAMADPKEEEVMEEEKKGMRKLRWADSEDDEGKEEEEQETSRTVLELVGLGIDEGEIKTEAEGKKEQEQEGEKEAEGEKEQEQEQETRQETERQEELTSEKPPGLEANEESEHEVKEDEERGERRRRQKKRGARRRRERSRGGRRNREKKRGARRRRERSRGERRRRERKRGERRRRERSRGERRKREQRRREHRKREKNKGERRMRKKKGRLRRSKRKK